MYGSEITKTKTDLGVVQSPLTKAWQGLSQQSQNLDPRRSVSSNKKNYSHQNEIPKLDKDK